MVVMSKMISKLQFTCIYILLVTCIDLLLIIIIVTLVIVIVIGIVVGAAAIVHYDD